MERNLYAANMNLAQRDWDKANPGRLSQLLGESEAYPDKGFEWYSLDGTARIWDAPTGRELLALNGHIDKVTCISWSPDGKRVLTSGYDRTPKIWDALTGRELLTLEVQARTVAASAFSPDGRSIVTAGFDGLTKIWEAASAAQVAAWREEEKVAKKLLGASLP